MFYYPTYWGLSQETTEGCEHCSHGFLESRKLVSPSFKSVIVQNLNPIFYKDTYCKPYLLELCSATLPFHILQPNYKSLFVLVKPIFS